MRRNLIVSGAHWARILPCIFSLNYLSRLIDMSKQWMTFVFRFCSEKVVLSQNSNQFKREINWKNQIIRLFWDSTQSLNTREEKHLKTFIIRNTKCIQKREEKGKRKGRVDQRLTYFKPFIWIANQKIYHLLNLRVNWEKTKGIYNRSTIL